jgi:hypothetical protein
MEISMDENQEQQNTLEAGKPSRTPRKMPSKAERAEKKRQELAALKQAELDLKQKRADLQKALKDLETKKLSQAERKTIKSKEAGVLCLIARCFLEHVERGDIPLATYDEWMDGFLVRDWDRKRYAESPIRPAGKAVPVQQT